MARAEGARHKLATAAARAALAATRSRLA